MSVNSSSFDDLPPPLHFFSNSSSHPVFKCSRSRTSIYVFSTLSITSILLLPVPILVLYLGYQQWRKQRSTTTATSHSDIFTYHSIVMQMTEFFGYIIFFGGSYIERPEMMFAGTHVLSVTSFGLALFHLLTCLERYLAVVHPITYRGLKQAGGVRIRNICVGCAWFLSFGWIFVFHVTNVQFALVFFACVTGFLLIVVCFCSIAVLCTLKRPRPGEVGGNREHVDQSKQRAFHTIMAIMGVLFLRFGGNLFVTAMYSLSVISDLCLELMSVAWFGLPSSLVLPLLFLHRSGKL